MAPMLNPTALELGRFDLLAPVIATPREIVRKFFR
jgi:hypothetical protein